jgi:hypothetical protein
LSETATGRPAGRGFLLSGQGCLPRAVRPHAAAHRHWHKGTGPIASVAMRQDKSTSWWDSASPRKKVTSGNARARG